MKNSRSLPRQTRSGYVAPVRRPRVPAAAIFTAIAFACCLAVAAQAQTTSTAVVDGLRENPPRVHALINARLVPSPGQVLEKGCIVLRDGTITEVGADVKPPADARIWDLAGATVYAGFIDSYSRYGLAAKDRPKPIRPEKPGPGNRQPTPPEESKPTGTGSWNPLVTPQKDAAKLIVPDEKDAEKWRALGFTSVVVVPGRGIFRGTSALVDLSGRDADRSLYKKGVAAHVAFQINEDDRQYPNSLMGCIALIRQTFLDAGWYGQARQFLNAHPASAQRPETNDALGALVPVTDRKQPVVFEAEDELDLLRALRLSDEFNVKAVLRGSGRDFRMLAPLKKAGVPVILTLDFPETPVIETPEVALDVELEELEYWNDAPENAAKLAKAGIPIVLSTDGLEDPQKKFWTRLRTAVKRGLREEDALAALTTTPAKLLGVDARLGSLEKGKAANLIVASGDPFIDENAGILAAWIDGEYYQTEKGRQPDPRGTYTLTFPNKDYHGPDTLRIEGETVDKLKASAADIALDAKISGETLLLTVPAKALGIGEGTVRMSATLPAQPGSAPDFDVTGQLPDGKMFRFAARKTSPFQPATKKEPAENPAATAEIAIPDAYPAGAYGRRADEPDGSGIVLVQNATIWTCGPKGKLENANFLVENGKIKAVGDNALWPAGTRIIDGTGLHVTPGLVDAHSHTGISRGVNEATHAVTCEVRIGDVLDSTDIAIYRELAGGVTTANVLHGSANPIGGQSQSIKLRWGGLPEDLKIDGAMPGVKFALGENVKQSNWGDKFNSRYPQTRMGVEEIMRDTFLAAREYERAWKEFREKPAGSALPPRRILRLEAALEILNKQRIIHIHSYRQDEISAFIRLAKEMGLTVAAFHHGLECYKVSDEIAGIGAGVSTFSDWWTYKAEVMDAIPYNGAMLQQAGVLTSFNSDSNELARRLNTEAAKVVKYGGLSEEEALKFVTINPARQLRLDKQLGSLEAGKDADFVIWNGPPLSSFSSAEQTWIDGKCYFDAKRDAELQKEAADLREKLIQKALSERSKDLQKAGDGDKKKDDPASTEKPTALEELSMHRAIHRALEQQGLYHGGLDRHNCSNADY